MIDDDNNNDNIEHQIVVINPHKNNTHKTGDSAQVTHFNNQLVK